MNAGTSWRMGLGPVFVYEWITAARRWQGYALRSLFVLLLLAALVIIWKGNQASSRSVGSRKREPSRGY
jgi:hypothetical protein